MLDVGDRRMEQQLQKLAADAPAKVFVCSKLDEPMSHLIEAGGDFFVMPSLFEPCGLNQMYSQAYGTVPIVSRVGGLVDTVRDADEDPEGGTASCASRTPRRCATRSSAPSASAPTSRGIAAVQRRGMARDFSWTISAAAYEALYRESL